MKIKINTDFRFVTIIVIVAIGFCAAVITIMNAITNNEYLALGEFYTKKCSVYNSEDLIYKDKFKGKVLIQCDNAIYFVDSNTYKNAIKYYQQHAKEKLN